MEHLLIKLAQQLDSIDEASLLALWETYAAKVARFEPSQRWEEAVLVLSFIQAKHLKNQLFNHHWAKNARPPAHGEPVPFALEPRLSQQPTQQKKATILAFQPLPETAETDHAEN